MAINFKQPKYILPLVLLPFLCLFFYVYHSSAAKKTTETKPVAGMNTSVGDVAAAVKKKNLADKLDAYRNTYKEADGNTAVNPIVADQKTAPGYNNSYSDQQKRTLDSINEVMKKKFSKPLVSAPVTAANFPPRGVSKQDQAMAAALNNLANRQREQQNYHPTQLPVKEKDPMAMFKQQMAYMDSMGKANDPAAKAEKLKQAAAAKAAAAKIPENSLPVSKADVPSADFNTVMAKTDANFIMAVIDENITGYAGSRLRLRLLEDIKAGSKLIPKGTYLYALITGFSGQRVTLSVKSIMQDEKLLPVKLDVYDLDGMQGLYIPSSAFRDFTKDLGTNTIQGVSIDNGSASGSQFLMSAADKVFQSTSTAIAGIIRKNKAKIKYNSYIYLIDTEAQQNLAQRSLEHH